MHRWPGLDTCYYCRAAASQEQQIPSKPLLRLTSYLQDCKVEILVNFPDVVVRPQSLTGFFDIAP